jgi:arginine/lysine/ornithine decarboxylase
VQHGLSIFETSSPSYILLASIDECLRYMLKSRDAHEKLIKNLDRFYKKCETLLNLKVTHFDDPGKIIIFTHDPQKLKGLLSEENIEIEMTSTSYVLVIATVCDTKKSLDAPLTALFKIDKKIGGSPKNQKSGFVLPEKALSIKDAILKGGDVCDIHDSKGKVSAEYIWAYPPGAPVLVPGEVITGEIIDYLNNIEDLKSTKGEYPKIYTIQGE